MTQTFIFSKNGYYNKLRRYLLINGTIPQSQKCGRKRSHLFRFVPFFFSYISFPDSINLSMGQLIRAPGSYEELLDNIQSEKHFLFNFNLSNLPQLFFLIINDIIYFETNKTCFIIKMKIKFSHPLTLQAYLVLVQWIWLKKRHSKTLRNQTWSSWRRSTCCSRWRRRWLKDASFNKSRNSKNRQDDAQKVP